MSETRPPMMAGPMLRAFRAARRAASTGGNWAFGAGAGALVVGPAVSDALSRKADSRHENRAVMDTSMGRIDSLPQVLRYPAHRDGRHPFMGMCSPMASACPRAVS